MVLQFTVLHVGEDVCTFLCRILISSQKRAIDLQGYGEYMRRSQLGEHHEVCASCAYRSAGESPSKIERIVPTRMQSDARVNDMVVVLKWRNHGLQDFDLGVQR